MVERFDYHHTMSESLGRYPEGQFVYYSDYAKLAEALRNIAEGNLGDEPWQANYSRIRQVARAALSKPAALPAEGKGESALVPPLTRPSYCKPHEFVLLASYCGDDTEGCTEQRPCAHCLAMCNIYGEDGMYLRQLGEFVGHPDATPSAPQPLEGAVKVDAVPARIEWRKRERTFPAVEEPWSVVDYHTGLLIQQHPEKYETRPLYALSAPSLSPAPQPVGEVRDGWRLITEDDRPPNDTEVLMGCWESWPKSKWVVEYGLYGSTKGGWIHGRMTHWLPSSYLPASPSPAAQEDGI